MACWTFIFISVACWTKVAGAETFPAREGSDVHLTGCDSVPELNRLILHFVETHVEKRVGRGECWDLANEALRASGASWDGRYTFGQVIDPKKECVFPGDIVQFEGVKAIDRNGTRTEVHEFQHHTAIIYEVVSPGKYRLAHQNTAFSGKKVGISELDVSHVVKGRIKIFRPVR